MKLCRCLRVLVLLAAGALASGCATHAVSLHEVREFADASSKLGGYAALSVRFRDTYQRERPYLSEQAEQLAKINDEKRRAAHEDFLSVQKAVVLYMRTLSMLAGDARYDLNPQLDALGSGLQAHASDRLEQRQVIAYTGLTRLLARAIASGYQGRSVRTMVRDGDADLRHLIEAMIRLTRLYAKTHENEKKTVLGIFDVEIAINQEPKERMLLTMGKVHLMEKSIEYRLVDKRYAMAMQGLTKVALGHQKMREHLDDLRSNELRHILADYARDLHMIDKGLHSD
jgi:hypothetical protein